MAFSPRLLSLFLFLSLPICNSSFSRPLDHRLSLPSLAHRDNPHSLAPHILRTSQVIVPYTTMRTLRHLSFSSILTLTLSLTHAVSSTSTVYKRELSIVGSDFFEQFNWDSENDLTNGRVNYLTLDQARGENLSYGSPSIPTPVFFRLMR